MAKKPSKLHAIVLLLLTPFLIIYLPQILHVGFFVYSFISDFIDFPLSMNILQNSLYSLIVAIFLLLAYFYRENYQLSLSDLKQLIFVTGIGLVVTFCFELSFGILSYQMLKVHGVLPSKQMFIAMIIYLKTHALYFVPLGLLAIFLSVFRTMLKQQVFDETDNENKTSGKFGSAALATQKDFTQLNAYQPDNGIFISTNFDNKSLYLPLCNKLTISPPGGGKTSASSIPLLLSHPGPVFVVHHICQLAVSGRFHQPT